MRIQSRKIEVLGQGSQQFCNQHSGQALPCSKCGDEIGDELLHQGMTSLMWNQMPGAMLAQDAAEANRMTYAGRKPQSLRHAKVFDNSRVEAMPLFATARKQGGLF